MNMRPSRVLSKLRRSELATCVKLNLADPRVAEIAAMAGFDSIWLDLEHVPNSIKDIENQVRAAKIHDVDTVVRVRRGSYSDLIHPLELDAAGIMVPHVMSLEDARQIVHQTRFHPVGRRALDGGNADGGYCGVGMEDYLRQANRERLVIVQIEDPEPMEDLERIAALDGIDMLFFGPGDFSHGLGVPGKMNDPRIGEARQQVAQAALRHGKFAGTVGTAEGVTELTELGYRFISVGADVLGLSRYFSEIVNTMARHAPRLNKEGSNRLSLRLTAAG